MRVALARQDVSTVYRLLQEEGYSQYAIGVLVGQSQPEVSGVVHGRRVRTYDVMVRIALGLGVPPGYMGLPCRTHTDCQQPSGGG
ncbi:MAG: helix-turn-helix transcriptional regulator [Actinobacteria bacterium]|nr:helix-turn-helix transcriptional regulator [Actinomycetota bacterium]